MVGLKLNDAKFKLEPVQDIQLLGLRLHLDQGRASLPISKSGDNSTCVPNILSDSFVVQRSVPVHEITQLGLRSHITGMITHEAPTMTLLFTRSDRPVYSSVSIRPFSPCHSTQAVAGPIISHIRNPYLAFPGRFHHFHGCLYPRLGCSHGGFPDFGCLDLLRTQAPHQCAGSQGGNIGNPTIGLSLTGPPCYDRYRQYHFCILYQQTGWDPFPHPVAPGSGPVSMSTVSRYSHPGQTHSRLPQCNSRPVISAEPAHHNRVESPPQSSESNILAVGNSSSEHVCHSPQRASSPVYVSSSEATTTGDRCSVTRLAVAVHVHFSTISPAHQSLSVAGRRGNTHSPLVAITAVVFTLTTLVCAKSFRSFERLRKATLF